MLSTKFWKICAVVLAVCLSGLGSLAADKSVMIQTIPPGAQVEVNGNVNCVTPCSITVPGYYFGRKHTALSAHGTQPVRVNLTKDGYAPKSVELTTGPIHWSSLNGVNNYDYYLISSESFTFQLDSVAGPAVVTPSPAPQVPAPTTSTAIVVASPSGVSPNQTVESSESPLVIRGVATDGGGILLVTINGSTANMRPQNTQATEFWSEPIPITPGNTQIEITALNSAHAETKLAFTVHYAPKAAPANSRALSKQEIVSLLKGEVPNTRVVSLVKERGIKFTPTADDLKEIRRAGGNAELVEAIQHAGSAQ